jgi:ABC-type bacteriocin/lantibiotic exporter with double-glycine peptidase domain
MSSKPPFIGQERFDTCMLACLRMLLAQRGIEVTEADLVEQVSLEEGGIDPDQLAALARRYAIKAEARQIDFEAVAEQVQHGRFPIVLLDRSGLDREFAVHAVIPIRISPRSVTVLDPLRGERRILRRQFAVGRARVGQWAVVWTE